MGASQSATGEPLDHATRRAAFTALYDAHVNEVYQFVHRRCRDRAVAEDVTQDVFLTAVRTVDDPATVTVGWLITVAKNRLIDVMRRETRRSDKLRVLLGGADDRDAFGVTVDRVVVEAALARLSVDHRLVLTLHYLDGHTVPALATKLGRSVKSIEGLLTRARRGLRQELGTNDE
jgi:RNA polymerase sigma-70 factor (ECF subfamily)